MNIRSRHLQNLSCTEGNQLIFVYQIPLSDTWSYGTQAAEKLDLKKQKPEIVLFELNLDVLLSLIPDSLQYSAIPKFPPIERDIALIVDETIPSSHIREMIKTFPSELIEDVSVFDYYKGGNIPRVKKVLRSVLSIDQWKEHSGRKKSKSSFFNR